MIGFRWGVVTRGFMTTRGIPCRWSESTGMLEYYFARAMYWRSWGMTFGGTFVGVIRKEGQ